MEPKKKRKGMRFFMLGIVFLAVILGVTNVIGRSGTNGWALVEDSSTKGSSNVVEWVRSKAEYIKDLLMPKNGREPPSVSEVKVADPTKAREILNSVGNAAEIFSIRVGGGGDSLFPTNAVQMRDNLPPVVAKSLEGCFSTSAVPLGGYVCQYQVDPARTNFLCKAIPANGYTGGVFVVRTGMTIRQVDNIVGNFTKSESRKRNQQGENMKKNKFIVGSAIAFSLWCAHGEEMIDYLRATVRDDGPCFTGACEDVRELKYPGQRFVHEIVMTIEGTGMAVTPRCWGWFKTRSAMYLRHVSHAMMIESIESTSEDLEKGIIKSRYKIQRLDEQLHAARAKNAFETSGGTKLFDSTVLGRWVKSWCEKLGPDKIDEDNKWWQRSLMEHIGRLIVAIDEKIASDGTYVADEEFVKIHLPGYSAVVGMLHDFRGTELVSTWEFGKGYTSINFGKTNLNASDRNMIAKLIYRTNPMSVNDVLPMDKKSGDCWTIDSRVIGGAVFDLGLDFDQVDGAIRCRHLGVELLDKDDAPDEFRLLSKPQMKTKTLDVPRDDRNRVELVTRNNTKFGDLGVSFSPYGKILVFDEHDKKGRHIYYLRELNMDGIVKSRLSRRANLLQDVEFTGTDLKVKLIYTQVRAK